MAVVIIQGQVAEPDIQKYIMGYRFLRQKSTYGGLCIYVPMPEKIDANNNDIGTTWEDYIAGKYVLLTEEQIAFKEANEGASVEEVFNMQLTPIPEPTPEELLWRARDAKRQEIYDKDIHHYYIDEQDAYVSFEELRMYLGKEWKKRWGNPIMVLK